MLCINHSPVSSPAAKQSHPPGSTHLKDVVLPVVEALGSCTHSFFLMLAIQAATQGGPCLGSGLARAQGRKKDTAGKGCDISVEFGMKQLLCIASLRQKTTDA